MILSLFHIFYLFYNGLGHGAHPLNISLLRNNKLYSDFERLNVFENIEHCWLVNLIFAQDERSKSAMKDFYFIIQVFHQINVHISSPNNFSSAKYFTKSKKKFLGVV